MASFDIFGPPTKEGLRVGYISTDRGYVSGVTLCEANDYAKVNPGAVFIFKTRKNIQYLNINEVNRLQPTDKDIPEPCDDGLKLEAPCGPAKAIFMGGGGVGVQGNPVIGKDGGVLAVDLVSGGFGYQYPPKVQVKDNCNLGAGAVTRAVMGEVVETEIVYSDEEDFEEYEICDPPQGGWGKDWTPDGKDLGPWNPRAYTEQGEDRFAKVVDQFIKDVQTAGKNWWTTRTEPPLKITSTGQTTRAFYKAKHKSWGPFMNSYAISPKPPSNAKPSDFAGQWFTFEWDVDFPYDGNYVFHTARDNKSRIYIDGVSYTDKLQTFTGTSLISGKVGPTGGHGTKLDIKGGSHKIRLDLYNEPVMEKVAQQQPPPASSSKVNFKITTGSMFANGIEIEGLNLNVAKPFTEVPDRQTQRGKDQQLNETFTRDVEFGKKYKVIFTSTGKESGNGNMPIAYSGLHPRNNPIRVTRGGKRIELKDDHGNDTNFALDIDSGNAKFSANGKFLNGEGEVRITSSYKDSPSGYAVDSIKIGNKIWRRSGRRGSETHTITLAKGSGAKSNIKLKTTQSNVIKMEDFTDNDWTDLICVASSGQFTDLKGNIAYFSVPHPPSKKVTPKAASTDTKGEQTRNVFNTADYINKANRQLWRTNVYSRGGFLNDYGVCPFDTNVQLEGNPYAGTHKIVWPSVNFPIDGNYDIEVEVDDNVELSIGDDVKITKKGFVDSTSVGTGKLKVTRFVKQGVYPITADLFQKAGGNFSFKSPDGKVEQLSEVTFKVTTDAGYANKITIPGLFSVGKEYKGTQLNQSFTRKITAEKDYDVILNSDQSNNVRVRIKDNGKRLEMEEWKDGDWQDLVCTVTEGTFHSPQGNRAKFRVDRNIKGINPMALAINIQTTFSEKEIQSKRSWNENPMGVALTIDAPLPPTPQQSVPQQEGRCPNNPFWTTRFPDAEKKWFPVRRAGWGKFLNKYGMSPVPPFDESSTSGGGIKFTNVWKKEVPYDGFFKIKMEADDIAEFWVDDEKVLDLSRRRNVTYGEKLFFMSKGMRELKIVAENYKFEDTKLVNNKVFNTLDWIGGKAAKSESKNIKFKITTGSMFANSIRIDELGILEAKPFTPVGQGQKAQINKTLEREVEVNKIYDVQLFSSGREGGTNEYTIKYNNLHSRNNPIRVAKGGKRIELVDGHGNDTNFALDIDSGNAKFSSDGKKLIVNGSDAKITASWKDKSSAGRAVDSVTIKGRTWRREGTRGSQTETLKFGARPDIKLRTVGESILQMEDHTDADWTDLICAASEGRFFDLQGDRAKFMISGETKVSGGIQSGETRGGITYSGPHLFHYQDKRWGNPMNRESVSPIATPSQNLSEPNDNITGKKIMTWKGVDFPQTGDYQISFIADNIGELYVDGSLVMKVQDNFKLNEYNYTAVKLNKGRHDIRVELTNGKASNIFLKDPTGFMLKISTNMTVGAGTFKSWQDNPIGVSASLIPPPCPKKVKGKGVVTEVIVDDPGNGYPGPKGDPYPVSLRIKEIVIQDPGINYDCAKDKVRITPDNGAKLSLCQCAPFGKIQKVCVDDPGIGFTEIPDITIESDTGVNFSGTPVFEVVRDPIVADPDKLVQVTDLVGLKQTGYYQGRPYYGAVFYQDGVRYAGWYETAGDLVQIYDTMQESIDAEVTTPPAAILRQGSDVSNNNKRLNLPGTPDNLT